MTFPAETGTAPVTGMIALEVVLNVPGSPICISLHTDVTQRAHVEALIALLAGYVRNAKTMEEGVGSARH